MVRFITIFLVLLSCSALSQDRKQFLENWEFRLDLPPGHHLPSPKFPAHVPGVVHLDLMHNNLAPNFYAGLNEHSDIAKELEYQDWVYTTSFEIYEKDLQNNQMELVFEGLDTYASVYLNDSLILEANNMFRTWIISIRDIVKIGTNNLRVHFITPLNKHEFEVMKAPYQLPSGNETGDLQVSAYTRKAAYQFGWDFAPRFVTCGIWRPCYIRIWDHFRINHFFAETKSISGTISKTATMQFHFELESDSTYAEPFTVEMSGLEFQIYIEKGIKEITFFHQIENPKLWYPNGYGNHPINVSTLSILDSDFKKVYSKDVHYGIRTIELVNEKDSIGTSFYFKVNGKPIFMKGANYIPQDLFLPRVTNQQTTDLITLVHDANMNMIRVWGGGIYESDFFYQQCDLRGILVWQDFMFANSMYPATEEFHKNVAAEIDDNVKRLRNHPCIALWCGNNEIEVAWHNWGWQKQFGYSEKDSTEIWENYKTIFHKLIPDKLKTLDPSRAYIPSSPQSNWGKPENFNHGAMHYWGVWHGDEPTENFKTNVGRFMVEYGFQSYPNHDLLSQYLTTDQLKLHFDSLEFKNLQKSYKGNRLIELEIAKYFFYIPDPDDYKMSQPMNKYENMAQFDWLWATQYVQGQALKTAIIAHRLKAPHCMGTLFWQLNDCWPGASWSVLDYRQTPKLSYLQVQKWFSPTIAISKKNTASFDLTVHSDIPITGKAILNFLDEESGETIKTVEIEFILDALETKNIWTFPLKKWKKKYDFSKLIVDVAVENHMGIQVFSDYIQFRDLRFDEIY